VLAVLTFTKLYPGEIGAKPASPRLQLGGDTRQRQSKESQVSDLSNQAAPSSGAPVPRRRGRGWLFITTVALAAAFTGALTTRAVTQGGFGPGYWHGPGFMRAPLTAADIEDRADRGIRHAAIELDATNEQQERLRSIAKAAVKDLLPLREKAQTARQRAAALLTQPTVDRAAIEAFRAEQMALADAASKRFAQAITEAAEVLTPDQRRNASERLEQRRGYWRGWHRG
jgi:Spy/CpxP family protein refolding chaperone